MLDAEANGRERILDLVRHLAGHLAPSEHTRRARQLRRIVERDDAAVRRGTQQRELYANLTTADLKLPLLDHDALPISPAVARCPVRAFRCHPAPAPKRAGSPWSLAFPRLRRSRRWQRWPALAPSAAAPLPAPPDCAARR